MEIFPLIYALRAAVTRSTITRALSNRELNAVVECESFKLGFELTQR